MSELFQISRRRFLKNLGVISASTALPLPWFAELPEGSKPIRFGVVTDSHYADRAPKGNRFYRDSLPKLQECIEFFNQQELDFIIHLGDFKDEAETPTESSTLNFLKTFEQAFTAYKGDTYHVLGNHDVDSITKEQFLTSVRNTGIARDRSYYSFDYGFLRFIVLDANFKQDGTAYKKGNFDWKDTFIPQDQLLWLQGILESSEKPCVVFVHQMLDDMDSPDHAVKNAAQVRQLLANSKKAIAVFQGHRHRETYHLIDHIHFYTFNAMVDFEGMENNSFSIVTVEPTREIKIEGYYRSSNQIFKNR